MTHGPWVKIENDFKLMSSYNNHFRNFGWSRIAHSYRDRVLCWRIQSPWDSWQTRKCSWILGCHRYESYLKVIPYDRSWLLILRSDSLGCAMAAVIEVLLGLSSCSACLTYADIVDRLEMRRQQVALAQKYPGFNQFNKRDMTLIFLDRFGSLLTSWSSRDSLNMKKDGHNLEDDDDLMNQKGKIVLLDIFFKFKSAIKSTIGAISIDIRKKKYFFVASAP